MPKCFPKQLYFLLQSVKAVVIPHPWQHLVFSVFFKAFLLSVQWYLVVSICIFLMTVDIEHLFMCLSTIPVFSLLKCINNMLLKKCVHSFIIFIYIFKNIFYWLCYYSCPIFPPLFPSALYPAAHHHSSTLVHAHESYPPPVYFVLTIYASCSLYLFPHSSSSPSPLITLHDLYFRESVPVVVVCLVCFCFFRLSCW